MVLADRTAVALQAESTAKQAILKNAAEKLGIIVWSFQSVDFRTQHASERAAMEALEPNQLATLEKFIALDEESKANRVLLEPAIALGAMLISGVVLQKTTDGLLITPKKPEIGISFLFPGLSQYDKPALIRAHPDTATLVDNDTFNSVAVPDGIYSYTNVAGATSTIRAFKWMPNPLNARKEPKAQ